jgi:Uma2 family endonuclease
MATVSTKRPPRQFEYPTSDGKPMAETDFHRDLMLALIETLKAHFAAKPKVYVSGNLLIYYELGNKRKHVSPDVFVVPGVPKKDRLYFLTWEEGKNPAFVIEITSSSTKREDKGKKFALYRDVLKVKEYFLFDPFGEYLKPQLSGYSLRNDEYVAIKLTEGRMASQVIGLHLEPAGTELRLYDPVSGHRLPTPLERAAAAEQRAELADREIARLAAENERQRQLLEKLMREKKNGH